MADVALSVRGGLYEGWQTVSITRSIEQFVSNFSVGFAEQWHEDAEPIPINEGDPVVLKIDGEPVINGYVDDSIVRYSAQEHSADVIGRAKTADLVDCSAGSGQWGKSTINQIAAALCLPFGITVTNKSTPGAKFRRYSVQEGETVHEALERAARMRGLLLITNGDGNLVLTRSGDRRVSTVLQRGINILECERNGSWRDRYSDYTIKTQAAGDDDFFGYEAAWIKRQATDDRVDRHRPLTMLAENEDTGAELQERINWERNIRAGRARRVTYTVQGWHDDDGDLWEPNTLVRVEDDFARISAELLLVSVRYEKNDGGTRASLELTRPEAFETIDFAPPKRKKKNSFFDDVRDGAKEIFR